MQNHSYRKHVAIAFASSITGSLGKRWKPMDGKSSENGLYGFPSWFPIPSCLFLLQRFDGCFVVPNGTDLSAKHDGGEKGKQKSFEHQKEEENDSGRWGVGWTSWPFWTQTTNEVIDGQKQGIKWHQSNVELEETIGMSAVSKCVMAFLGTYRKKNKVFLVALSYAIIDPRTMMVHFPNTSLTDTAMMCSIRFDTAAFGTLEYHLTLFKPHLRDVFFGSIAPRHSTLFKDRLPQLQTIFLKMKTHLLLTGSLSIVRTWEETARTVTIMYSIMLKIE